MKVNVSAASEIDQHCRVLLAEGLLALDLPVSEHKQQQLLAFIKLMEKWNNTYNLTAIRQRLDMVTVHLLDSLAVLPYLVGQRVIDIGTGAGLPGIPLAICLPETEFLLLDRNAKKTRFVQQAVLELRLKNVSVVQCRVEDYQSAALFTSVLTRAFASLADIVAKTEHLLAPGGVLLCMKGQAPDHELSQLTMKSTVVPIKVPGIDASRCLVQIESL